MTVVAIPIDRKPSRFVDVARVLEEAEDPSIPLPERLRFLAKAGSALEDAFRVQTAAVAALKKAGSGKRSLGRVQASRAEVLLLQERLSEIWCGSIAKRLNQLDIRFVGQRDLDTFGRSWTRTYFEQQVVGRVGVRPIGHPGTTTRIEDGCYLAVSRFSAPAACAPVSPYPLAVVSMPVPGRIAALPEVGDGRPVIWLDDVIRANLDRLVPECMPCDAHAFRQVTLTPADLDQVRGRKARLRLARLIDEDGGSRRFLEYDRSIPYPVLTGIRDALGLEENQLVAVGRYPAFADTAELAGAVEAYTALRAVAAG